MTPSLLTKKTYRMGLIMWCIEKGEAKEGLWNTVVINRILRRKRTSLFVGRKYIALGSRSFYAFRCNSRTWKELGYLLMCYDTKENRADWTIFWNAMKVSDGTTIGHCHTPEKENRVWFSMERKFKIAWWFHPQFKKLSQSADLSVPWVSRRSGAKLKKF